jgi:uncharacterized integral membrane protein
MTSKNTDLDQEVAAGSTPTTEPAPTVSSQREFVGTGLFWGLVVGVLLAAAVVILAAQNTASTTIAFLGWEFSTPLIVVILGTLLIAVVADELFGLVYRARRRRTLGDRDQLKRIKRSNRE